MAENNCATCNHKRYPDGGHCYMFRVEPAFLCMQHPDRKPTGTIGHINPGSATLIVAIATALGENLGPLLDGSGVNLPDGEKR